MHDPASTPPQSSASVSLTGFATPAELLSSNVTMVSGGQCLEDTLDHLESGEGAKPLPRAALESARGQAETTMEAVLQAYENEVAAGEIGANGTARCAPTAPVKGSCPTGLLYGRIQSGKTVAMITLSSMAIDNGFRVIVVFTSNYVKLVEQTRDRFGAIEGPIVMASTNAEEWEADRKHLAKHMGDIGLVVVCAKDSNHVTRLRDFLDSIDAGEFPALILDDEADQATPDTNTRARAQGKDVEASAIHSGIEGVRKCLRHHVFLQVTATPFPLLLQNIDSWLRPSFTRILEPGEGYTGGERFFSSEHVKEEGSAPIVFVDESESEELQRNPQEVPVGLRNALAFFLLSASAQAASGHGPKGAKNFLCHTSFKTDEHDKLANLIRGYLDRIQDALEDPRSEPRGRIAWAYGELAKTVSELPELESLLDDIRRRLPRRKVPVVNSATASVKFGRGLNFIVGGNILGRGLTIDQLLVTYYIRSAQTTQMDTMLQHARMFGYRESLMPFTRVFLPKKLAHRFLTIHETEDALRRLLRENDRRDRIPVEYVTGLRATRPNVLDPDSLSVFRAGQQVYPHYPACRPDEVDARYFEMVQRTVDRLMDGSKENFVPIGISDLLGLIKLVRTSKEEDPGRWDKKAIAAVLESIAPRYGNRGYLRTRPMRRTGGVLTTGAIGGSGESGQAKELDSPIFFLFHDSGDSSRGWHGEPFWYPTLIFPKSMGNQVFDASA